MLAHVLAYALPLCLGAQAPDDVGRYATAEWSTEHGLPSSIITGVAQTPDGYLWLASYEGLVRFDGLTFHTFGTADIPGLERGSFIALAVDPAATSRTPGAPDGGTLWAASESGELVRLRAGRWRVFTKRDGLPGAPITALARDGAGGLWIGTRSGVWHLSERGVWPLPRPAGTPPDAPAPAVGTLATDARGTLWIGTVADGLLRVDGAAGGARPTRVTQVTTRDGLASDRVDALHVDADSTLWVGAYGARGVTRVRTVSGALQLTDFGTRSRAPGADAASAADTANAPRRVRFLLRDRAGTLWLAAENGLFALRGAEPREAVLVPLAEPAAVGLGLDADGRVKAEALAEDAEGNLWVGTRQSGLFRLRAASFVTRGAADGLPNPFVFAVDGDGAGGAWVATQDGAAHLPASGPAVVVAAAHGRQVRDVLRAPSGDVWLATTTGLTRLAGGRADRAVTWTSHEGLADDRVRALAAGRDGVVWAATFDGVSEWRPDATAPDGGRLRRYGPAEGLTDGYVLSVFEDRAGTLWVGTQTAGLFRCPPVAGDPTAGAPRRCAIAGPALARQPVFRLTEDAGGTLWAGTSRGLARVRLRAAGGPVAEVALLSPHQGLPGSTIFQALDDGRGALWLTGPWGIGRVERAALNAVADGRRPTLTVTPFGRGDGMAAREASSISRAWRAADGTLWFPTPAGVAVVDPARLPSHVAAPRVLVEQVLADGVGLSLGDDGRLPLRPGTRTLELRLAAPSFTAPEQVRLRWRLEGFDPDWVEAGARRVAYYTNLSPGAYRFAVQARAGDGPWSTVTVAALDLAPHLWQRPTVLVVATLTLVVGGAAAYRRRVGVVARAAAQRAALAAREEALRAAALRDELTGLYNRRGMLELAEQAARTAARERRGLTLLFVDLDGLKAINDTLGHATGDQAIVDAGAVLRATFREADVVARLGGDEFAVLLSEPPERATDPATSPARDGVVFEAVRARLADAVASHNATAGRPYVLAMSVGASRGGPNATRSIAALLADADRTMYEAKRARRATRETAAIPG